MSVTLKDHLEELVSSPGWQWFTSRVDKEWGPQGDRFLPELKSALNITDNNAAASQARQILSAQAVINALLRAPQDEITRLKHAEPAKETSVRPPLEDALAGQSRRGGL